MYKKIINVSPFPDYKLLVTFETKEIRLLDMKPYLDKGIFTELQDIDLFDSAHVSLDTIEWSNQANIDPEFVYSESVPYNL